MKPARPCPKCGERSIRTVTAPNPGGGWTTCMRRECEFTVYAAEGDPVTKWNEIAALVTAAGRRRASK